MVVSSPLIGVPLVEICVLPNPFFLLLFSTNMIINQYVFVFHLVHLELVENDVFEIEFALSLSLHESQQHGLVASIVDRL